MKNEEEIKIAIRKLEEKYDSKVHVGTIKLLIRSRIEALNT